MKKIILPLLVFALFSVSCKQEKQIESPNPVKTAEIKKVKVKLEPKSDSKVSGNVVFTEDNGKVTVRAIIQGLDAGTHAIHIHEKSDCSSPDGKSTGGHWNPTAQPHGKWGAGEGYHKGDIGNLTADDKGFAALNFSTNEWCIGCGDTNKDILGKAIIVHAGADDFTSQPTGAAGGRVSCGGIIQ